MDASLQYLFVLAAALICLSSSATIPQRDCVERSLCYHSLDCCSGCCEDNQCVTTENVSSVKACSDFGVARNCSSLKCPKDQECSHEMRFCLIAPCPQPLPECVPRKFSPTIDKSPVPLPVKY